MHLLADKLNSQKYGLKKHCWVNTCIQVKTSSTLLQIPHSQPKRKNIHVDSWINHLWITLDIILFKINWKFSVQSSAAKPSSPRSMYRHWSALDHVLQRIEHASGGTRSAEWRWNCRWIIVSTYLGTILPIYIVKGGKVQWSHWSALAVGSCNTCSIARKGFFHWSSLMLLATINCLSPNKLIMNIP